MALSSPLHVGLYEDTVLIEQYSLSEQISEALPQIFEKISKTYRVKQLFFAKGPGSFMSIKVSYIFLKTLSITLGIPLYATDGFTFNGGAPIKAMRQLYFVKEDNTIVTKIFETPQNSFFKLPKVLDKTYFDENTEPLYMLPAV